MTRFLDEVARSLARPMPRSRALRVLGGALLAAVVPGVRWTGSASARPARKAAAPICSCGYRPTVFTCTTANRPNRGAPCGPPSGGVDNCCARRAKDVAPTGHPAGTSPAAAPEAVRSQRGLLLLPAELRVLQRDVLRARVGARRGQDRLSDLLRSRRDVLRSASGARWRDLLQEGVRSRHHRRARGDARPDEEGVRRLVGFEALRGMHRARHASVCQVLVGHPRARSQWPGTVRGAVST